MQKTNWLLSQNELKTNPKTGLMTPFLRGIEPGFAPRKARASGWAPGGYMSLEFDVFRQ
jgi:hypothetical protein